MQNKKMPLKQKSTSKRLFKSWFPAFDAKQDRKGVCLGAMLFVLFMILFSFSDAFAKDEQTLIAKGDYNYPPYEYLNTSNHPDGFNVDIINAVARAMDLDIKIEVGLWHVVRSEIETGQIDILMGMFETGERAKLVDFSVPYLITSYAVFVPEGSKIKSINDIRNKKIMVQRDDMGNDYVSENKLSTTIITRETSQQVLEALAAGKADCAILPRLQGVIILKDKKIKHIKIVGSPIIQRKYCMAVAKGDSNLLAKLNEGLKIIKTSGEYYKIYNKWFGVYTSAGWTTKQIIKYVLMIVLPLLLIILLILLWNWSLKKQVALRTEKLRITLNSIGDAVIATDTNGLVTRMNPVAETLTGWKIEDAINKPLTNIFNIINATTGKPVENPAGKVLATGNIVGLANHTILIAKDGRRYQIADSAAPILNKEKQIKGVVLVFRDVTKEYAKQEELNNRTIMLNMVMNNIPSMIFWKDRDSVYRGCNEKFVRSMGYSSAEEILGKSDLELLRTKEEAIIHQNDDKQIMNSGVAKYHTIQLYSNADKTKNAWIDTSKIPLLDENGKVFGILGSYQDITEQKYAEEELREQKRQLDSMVSHLPGFVYRCKYDNDWTMLYMSSRCKSITGYEPDDFICNKILFNDIIQKEYQEQIYQKWEQIIAEKTSFEMEYEIKTATNEIKWIWERGTPMFDEAGNVMCLEGYIEDITERKNSEEALQRSEAKLRRITDNISDVVFTSDMNFNISYISPSIQMLTGFTIEEYLKQEMTDRYTTETLLKIQSMLIEELEKDQDPNIDKERTRTIELEEYTKNGSTRHVSMNAKFIRDISGNPIGIQGVSRDITARKKAELELSDKLVFQQKLIDSIPYPVFTKNAEGVFVGCNLAYERDFGTTRDLMLGKTILDLEYIPIENRQRFHDEDIKIIQSMGHRNYEMSIIYADKQTHQVIYSVNAFSLTDGKPGGLIGMLIDISDRKRAEEAIEKRIIALTQPLDDNVNIAIDELFNIEDLQKLQDDFANAIGLASIITTPDGVPITKPSNFTYFCNEIVRKTEKGCANCYKSDAIIGRISETGPTMQKCMSGGLWDAGAGISVGGKHVANWLVGQVRNEEQGEKQIIAYAKEIGADVEEMLAAFRAVPAMSEDKFAIVAKTVHTLATQLSNLAYQNIQQARFIAERKRVEIELIASKNKAEESDRLKSAFLANMSHEIRTPMNGILGFAELLKNSNLSGEKRQQFLEIISASGDRLLNIINDLINISKIESGEMHVSLSEIDVLEPLSFMYDFFRPEVGKKGLELFIKYPDMIEPTIVCTDKEKIYAILTNLIKNAIKFTKEGSITFGYTIKDKMLEFYVQDTGIGIAEGKQRVIFDRFIQADDSLSSGYEGSGLGLAISKAYVEMLGGSIRVESEIGKGTTFYFSLPNKKAQI